MSTVPLLDVKNLRIGHEGTPILPPISFTVLPGQVTSIVGHNGSGKSTLLKTLLGLYPKVSGTYELQSVARFGYVPQREAMDPIYPIRVSELVETGRYGLRGIGRWLEKRDRDAIRLAMEETRITHLSRRLFRTLSGGEQQRALLARALCVEPTVVVLDEPTASMDERAATEAMTLTMRLAKERGAAILMVNHFIDLVSRLSDQVVLLDRDHDAVLVGTPAETLKNRGRFA